MLTYLSQLFINKQVFISHTSAYNATIIFTFTFNFTGWIHLRKFMWLTVSPLLYSPDTMLQFPKFDLTTYKISMTKNDIYTRFQGLITVLLQSPRPLHNFPKIQ